MWLRTLWLYLVISSLLWSYFKTFFPIKCVPRSNDKKVLKLKKLRFVKIKIEKMKNLLEVTNSNLKNKNFLFELLTRKLSFSFFTFNWLTQSWKYLFSLRVNNSMVKLLFFGFWVTNSGLKNKRSNFELLTPWVTFYFFTYEFHLREIDKWKKSNIYYSSNVREPLEINTIPYFF